MSQTALLGDVARPENPAPIAENDIYASCRDFLLAYALPALDPASVIFGWHNLSSLPTGTDGYAVLSIISDKQHGTTVETFRAEDSNRAVPGILTVRGLIEVCVQVDICGPDDIARQRARRLATVTRSSIGVQFFADRGMSVLYADDARDMSFVNDAQEFVRRHSTTLRLSYWSGDSVEMPYFDSATVARLENVNVHHPL